MIFFLIFSLIIIITAFSAAEGGKPFIILLLTLSTFIFILYLIGTFHSQIPTVKNYHY